MAARIVDALSHPGQRNRVDGKRTDDTTTRWLVQKRTYFKGNYDRVLTVAETSIGTQMPNLQFTNVYTLAPDFSVKSLTLEKDCLVLQAKPTKKVRVAAAAASEQVCLRLGQVGCRTSAADLSQTGDSAYMHTSDVCRQLSNLCDPCRPG